jgi:hypothetical protein
MEQNKDVMTFENFKKKVLPNSVMADKVCKILYISTLFKDEWRNVINDIYEGGVSDKTAQKVNEFISNDFEIDNRLSDLSELINEHNVWKTEKISNSNISNSINMESFISRLIKDSPSEKSQDLHKNLNYSNLYTLYLSNMNTIDNHIGTSEVYLNSLEKLKYTHRTQLKDSLIQNKLNFKDERDNVIEILRCLSGVKY